MTIVTGAASGIGRASAIALAREGARVVVSDVATEGGEETVRMITAEGGEAIFVRADVAKATDCEALVKATLDQFGRLDCAFNNAGIEGPTAPAADFPLDGWDRVIGINLTGAWYCMRAEIPAMLATGGGSIVNCASVAGLVGFQGSAAYVASKHGLVGLTKTAALDYSTQGIRVNAICPGVIDTEMVRRAAHYNPDELKAFTGMEPIGRLGLPEEIADAAVWLLSDRSSFVTGQAIAVDGGLITR